MQSFFLKFSSLASVLVNNLYKSPGSQSRVCFQSVLTPVEESKGRKYETSWQRYHAKVTSDLGNTYCMSRVKADSVAGLRVVR